MTDSLSQLPHLTATTCAIKKFIDFILSNNNHPQLVVFQQQLEAQHLGQSASAHKIDDDDDDEYGEWSVAKSTMYDLSRCGNFATTKSSG
jgi:hypothetical protein